MPTMKEWCGLKPELFSEQPYCLTGCDSYPLHHFGTMQRPQPGGTPPLYQGTRKSHFTKCRSVDHFRFVPIRVCQKNW